MNENAKRIYTALIDALAYVVACGALAQLDEVLCSLRVCAEASGLPVSTYDKHADEVRALRCLVLALAEAVVSDDLGEDVYQHLDRLAGQLMLHFYNHNSQPEGHFSAMALPVLLNIYTAGKSDASPANAHKRVEAKKKSDTTEDFRAACERLGDVVTDVAFHPDCPAQVRDDLLAVCCEILNRVEGVENERARFDVRLAFSALANGQLAA